MLLFNLFFLLHLYCLKNISIHLMLLFNILCFLRVSLFDYFNTSNVTIQPPPLMLSHTGRNISIHLMLLFNLLKIFPTLHRLYFNTSNVTIQPELWTYCYLFNSISIHLMLLFNILTISSPCFNSKFQYI